MFNYSVRLTVSKRVNDDGTRAWCQEQLRAHVLIHNQEMENTLGMSSGVHSKTQSQSL